VQADEGAVLVDCGPSALGQMRRAGIYPSTLDAVAATDLRPDRIAGMAVLVNHARLTRRERPLVLVGPEGLRHHLETSSRVLSPVTTGVPRRFALHTMEALPASEVPLGFGTSTISLIEVARWTTGSSYGVVLRVGGRVIAYSGLSDGIDPLIALAEGADVLVTAGPFGQGGSAPDPSVTAALVERVACRVVFTREIGERAHRPPAAPLEVVRESRTFVV